MLWSWGLTGDYEVMTPIDQGRVRTLAWSAVNHMPNDSSLEKICLQRERDQKG